MRILHTADWHIGKKLGRVDRRAEFEQVLQELIEVARDQKVDLVLVAGDLLDRALPQVDSIRLAVDTLVRLAQTGSQVVAIPGNHDSPALFELLGPLLEPNRVHLVPRIRKPGEGGLVRIPSRDGNEFADVAALPFLHEAEFVDFMAGSEEWFKTYADKIRLLCKTLCDAMDSAGVGLLVGHFFIDGAALGGGERTIHIGSQYAATPQAIPPTIHYAALGHVHRPQAISGAPIGARYAGSLLQLDFSERTHTKEVVIVEATAGRPAKIETIPLTSGRPLLRVEDSIESLESRALEFADAYLDVRVKTDGPVFGLAERVRKFLPNALLVQAVYQREEEKKEAVHPAGRPLHEVYADYHRTSHGVQAPSELIEAFRSLEEDLERELASA